MKITTTKARSLGLFIVALLLNFIYANAQTWDYVNITDGTNISNKNACIDTADNIYTFGNGASYTRVLRKFDQSGDLSWEKDVSNLISYSAITGFGGIEYYNDNIYAIGNNPDDSVIVKSGTSASAIPEVWDMINSSGDITVSDVKIKGDFIYVVGYFNTLLSSGPTTLTFFDGTTLIGLNTSTFIAKYSIAPKTLVWVKKIDGNDGIRTRNIDVDDSGNIFISGDYRGTAIFYSDSIPFPYTTDDTEAFMTKYDADGNYDYNYGVKHTDIMYGYWDAFDIEVDDVNNMVVWSVRNAILAHSKNGSGSHLWTIDLPSTTYPYSIETNNCGDLYVTGEAGEDLTRGEDATKAPCAGDYFGISLDAATGNTIWASNSESCISRGTQVLIDSNNKEVFVGNYFTGGGSGNLVVDGTYSSSTYFGYFIGRYDDLAVNSCCDASVNLGANQTVCDGDDFPTLDISSQVTGNATITWSHNGNVVQNGGTTLTPSSGGSYSVVVDYGNGCSATDTMVVNLVSCEPDCDVRPKFKVKIKKCTVSLSNLSAAGSGSQIIGYLWDFGDGTTSTEIAPNHTYEAGGTYTITLYVYGIDSNGNCCVAQFEKEVYIAQSCISECKMKPAFTVAHVGNGVSMFTSTSSTNGFTNIVGYEWTIDGVVVSNDAYFAQPFNGGQVCLTIYGLTKRGDCCMDRACRYVTPSHETEKEEDEGKLIKIFPNPTQDSFKIDVSNLDLNTVQELSIFDMYGRLVLTQSNVKDVESINTASWPIGVYICQIKMIDKMVTKKIIKK